MIRYINISLTEVEQLATKLAAQLRGHGALIGLSGPLGSGKTTFIKAFAKSLGVKHVTSPTFVITHEYRINAGRIYHLDFYRLKKSRELSVLGLEEMRTGKNLVLIEWVDRFPKLATKCDILITFTPRKDNKRDVTFKSN